MSQRKMSDLLRDQQPLTLPGTASVQEAGRCMREGRVGAVLVVDRQRRLIGIFTARDAVARVLAEGLDSARTSLASVMTKAPTTCVSSGCTAVEALRLMRDGGFRHLPIVHNDKLVGIVSQGDFRGLEKARLDEETGLWERL